jgi:hypothetical protein
VTDAPKQSVLVATLPNGNAYAIDTSDSSPGDFSRRLLLGSAPPYVNAFRMTERSNASAIRARDEKPILLNLAAVDTIEAEEILTL